MSFRKITSLLLVVTFLILSISGIILFIMPHGRVAYWTDWRFFNLNKDQWSELHIIFSFSFIIIGILHIIFNFKPLKFYLKKAKKEVFLTVLISFLLLFGSIYNFTPFSIITNLEESIKNSWIDNKIAPKIPHGELWPLKKLIKKLNISKKEAISILKKNNIKVDSVDKKIKDIAKENNVKPVKIYKILKEK